MFQQTIIRYCKFSNSNKQFCGRSNRASIAKLLTRYPQHTYKLAKDFPKERYNTYAKSCNSNLYTKYPGATYSGLLLGTMRCL